MSDNNLNLVDGKFYSFSFNGCACAGVFIKALKGDDEEDGFYCNGQVVCSLADAEQIILLYSEGDLPKAKDDPLLAEKALLESIEYDKTTERLAKVISKEADESGFHGRARDGFVLDVANYVEGLQKRLVSQ